MIAQSIMDIASASALLGGLSPRTFMRRHWQKTPLMIEGALRGELPFLGRDELFRLAADETVESRLVVRNGARWRVRQGPIQRRALPSLATPHWTLLVQGVDLHLDGARRLLDRFRFVPDARLDDVMVSYASDGGGVGPHVDSYDVFLLQLHGKRRWRVGAVAAPVFMADVPLRLLADFTPSAEWLLGPGDMLYLPPGWGHDGIAEGECVTCSIGFRAPQRDALAGEMLERMLDAYDADADAPYADPSQPATAEPGRVPARLQRFADRAIVRMCGSAQARACALGEVLTEPKPGVAFAGAAGASAARGVALDRRSRMLYDDWHVFINGEALRASGRDAAAMHRLADARRLPAGAVAKLGRAARDLLDGWVQSGWLQPLDDTEQA